MNTILDLNTTLAWLTIYQGPVSSISTCIIAFSSIVTAYLTWNLFRENRLLRKVGAEPEIIAYLSTGTKEFIDINFALINVGRGPARNIEFQLNGIDRVPQGDDLGNATALRNNPDRKPIGFLAEAEKWCVFFGSGPALLCEPRLPPFEVTVHWQNLKGKQFCDKYQLDVTQFVGTFPPS